MTTINHLNSFEKLESETMENLSRTADELLCVEHLDFDNTEYLANVLLLLGRHDESIEQFERMLLLKEDDKKALAGIAINHFKNKDYKTAIEYLNRGLEIDPEDERILSYKMLSCEFMDEYDKAIRCGEKLLKINPKNKSAIMRLIECHLKAKNYSECLYYLDQVKYYDSYKKALILFEARRYDECIEETRKAKTAEAYHLAGKSCLKLGNTIKAVKYLYKSYEKDPNVDILFEISDIYLEVMDYQKSIIFLNMALAHDEENPETYSRIARAHYKSSNYHDAVEYAEKALEINKKILQAYITLAETYFCMFGMNSEKIIEVIDEGISENPDSAELWAKKGYFYYSNDDLFAFRESYEKAISLNPCDCTIYEKYISILLSCDEIEEAKKQYNQMLLFNPLFEKSFHELESTYVW